MEITLENSLIKFIRILRHLGVRVSSSEAIDAYNALQFVDMAKPQEVRSTLQTTLVKNKENLTVFDLAFHQFFAPLEDKMHHLHQRQEFIEQKHTKVKEVEAEFTLDASAMEDSSLPQEVKIDLTEEQKMTYAKLPDEAKEKIQGFIHEHLSAGNQINSPHNLLQKMVQGQLNYWRRQLQASEEMDERDFLDDISSTGDAELDDVIERVQSSLKTGNESILYEDMANIAEKDIPRVISLIRKLSRKLATRISRRFHRSKRHKIIDIRKSIRRSIPYGGTIIDLKYKTRRLDKPKVVLICDVSGSMARYASFVLQFIYGLSSVLDGIESFIFSEDLEKVSAYFNKGQSFESTMAKIMNDSKEWGKSTNLNRALITLTDHHQKVLSRDTIVIIVSDGRTLEINQAAKRLERINKQVKEVIWLNTLPKREWSRTSSIDIFQKYSRMFECYTLALLERIMRKNLGSR